MNWPQIACAAAIVLSGGLLQGTVGFGFGLFAVPLLLTIGLPVPTVLAMAALCTVVQSANGVHHLRHVVPWRLVGVSFLVRAITLLLGIWVLSLLVGYPVASIKFWVGLVMLLLLLLQMAWQPHPRSRLHRGWDRLFSAVALPEASVRWAGRHWCCG